MSDQPEEEKKNDSFEIPVKKSPIFIYAMVNIGFLIFMVCLLYFMYQYSKES